MAKPAQLVVEAAGDGYLRLKFVQGGVTMLASDGFTQAQITLQYPRQGELVREEGDPSATEEKAERLNHLLVAFNYQLDEWCS